MKIKYDLSGLKCKAKVNYKKPDDNLSSGLNSFQKKSKFNKIKITIICLFTFLTLNNSSDFLSKNATSINNDGWTMYPPINASTKKPSFSDEINIYLPVEEHFEIEKVVVKNAKKYNKIMPGDGRITSGYGFRRHPIFGGRRHHNGVDFKASKGDPVKTVADGVVIYSGWNGGYGKMIDVKHSGGYVTRYAHNSKLIFNVGDKVKAGDVIAKAGSTGRSTGPHIHFEVIKNGKHINPMKFLEGG